MNRATFLAAAAWLCSLVAAAANAGVILVSQDRYTRDQFEQKSLITGQIISQSNVFNPADGFLPFTDTTGRGQQTSTVSTTALVASGAATGGASVGTSTSTWSLGVSQFKVVFNVVDSPQDFEWVETTPPAQQAFQPFSLTGPTTIHLPQGATLTGTLAPGQWTLNVLDAVGGPNFGSPGLSLIYNSSLTFVPEPGAASLGAVALASLIRRRHRRTFQPTA